MTSSNDTFNEARDSSCVVAYVQLAGREIRYEREGRGSPLILLADQRLRAVLQAALSRHFCVIAPKQSLEMLGRDTDSLSGFIDALGLCRPAVVAEGRWGAAPRAWLIGEADSLAGLALVCDRDCRCVTAPGVLSAGSSFIAPMCLHIRTFGDAPDDGQFAAMLDFLMKS